MQISHSISRQMGQALTEYMVGAIFLMIIVWYGLVGGSVDADGNGGLWEDDATVVGTGTYLDQQQHGSVATPGLVQALHQKQVSFVDRINQP